MPSTILATTVIVTRNAATNNFQFLVQNASGGQRIVFCLLQADMATAAALGNGASATFAYPQDGPPGRNDFPQSYTTETGS